MTTDQTDTAASNTQRMSHTPGPWESRQATGSLDIHIYRPARGEIDGRAIAILPRKWATGGVDPERMANKVLIRAAPRLLSALKEIAAILESDRLMMSDIAKADEIANAAIAKAEAAP